MRDEEKGEDRKIKYEKKENKEEKDGSEKDKEMQEDKCRWTER